MTSCSGDRKVSVFKLPNDILYNLYHIFSLALKWKRLDVMKYFYFYVLECSWTFNLISLKTLSSLYVTFTVPFLSNVLFNGTLGTFYLIKLYNSILKIPNRYLQTKRSLTYVQVTLLVLSQYSNIIAITILNTLFGSRVKTRQVGFLHCRHPSSND